MPLIYDSLLLTYRCVFVLNRVDRNSDIRELDYIIIMRTCHNKLIL
jgi:hypothetical protein